MGFYGNITNTSKTNFIFDKIYTNRKAMDSNISKDGIFIGRYVLVEYGEITEDSFIRGYGPQADGYYHISNDNEAATRILYTTEPIPSKDNYVKKGQIIYILGIGGKYNFLECNGGANKGKPTFTENPGLDPKTDPYFYNLKQDQAEYNVSRGYDGTVWVKTSVNNEIKYVNIAELNSVVPSFEMVADAPTMSPILPHFDTASNNVYYKLHWQPAWGMRIAETTDGSDKFSDYITSWSQEVYNKETGEISTQWYFPNELQEDGRTKGVWRSLNAGEQPPTINADIYFNHDAFDSQIGETNIHKTIETNRAIYKPITLTSETYKRNKYYYKSSGNYYLDGRAFSINRTYYEKLENYIGITADGLSGNKYNLHDGTLDTKQKPDTQQIHINLPAIGNMMSEAWDIIHGEKRDNTRTDEDGGSLQGRLDSFMAFYDNQIPVKNENGTIVGSKINGAQSYDSDWEGKPIEVLYDNTTPGFERDDAWIKTEINTNGLKTGDKGGESDQADNSGISIHHTFHATTDTKATLDKNNGAQTLKDINGYDVNDGKKSKIPVLNKSGEETGKEDTIKLYTPYVDAKGHVVGKNIETITLPYSFKTITAENSTNTDKWSQLNGATSSKNENVKNIVADNTKDTFNFKGGNKWIRFETDANTGTDTNNTTTSDGNNSLTIAHETHNIVTTPLTSDFNDEEDIKYIKINLTKSEYKKGKYYWYNNTTKKYEIDNNDTLVSGREHFIVNDKIAFQDLKFDTAGHVTDNQTHTYTLPYGYKYFETNGLSNEHGKDLYTRNADNEGGSSEEKNTRSIANKTEAHNTQDLLAINPANKWIQTQFVDNDGRQDELVIAHEIHSIDERDSENGDKDASNKGTSHTNLNKETGATNEINLTMYDWSYDKAGHITSKRKHTYTLPFGYKTFTDGTNSSVANSTQDTFKFIGDSWLKPTVSEDQITYTHIGPVATAAQNLSNKTPKFGDVFTIEDWAFDSKGHKANRSTHTIKIPGLSLTNDITGGNVVTSIEYKYDTTNHEGSFTETKEDIGTLQLGTHTGTTTTTKGLNILSGDTISEAFDKTQTHINSLKLSNESATEFISKITQTDGQVAVERAAAGTLVLGKENADYSVPATADTIVYNDSLATAFGKVEAQIKAETAARQKEIADLIDSAPEALDTLGEVAAWINNDTTGAAAMANAIATLNSNADTSGSVANSIKTEINKLNKGDTAKTGQYVSAVSETNGIISVTRTALPTYTLQSGTTNGTVKFNDEEVAVQGLGSAAYENKDSFATSSQGQLADTAIQLDTEFVYDKIQQDDGEGNIIEEELKTTIQEMAKEIASLKQVLKDNGLITE